MKKYLWKLVLGFCVGIFFLWLFMGISASAREKMEREEDNQYFLEQEKILIRDVRNFLKSSGYQNSGVTVSRTVYGDGIKEYKVVIHHAKIDALDESEKEELRNALAQFSFDAKEKFLYEFLDESR